MKYSKHNFYRFFMFLDWFGCGRRRPGRCGGDGRGRIGDIWGEESDADDLHETMVDTDMLGRDEPAKKKAKIDPWARKSKDVAKLLGVLWTTRKADEMWDRGWQFGGNCGEIS